jgi:hypothetical protein
MTDDLAAFVRRRLDEDEQIARAACEYAEAEWRLDEEYGETVLWWPPEPRVAEAERRHGLPVTSDQWRGQTIESGGTRIAPHIARHDPARVLADVAAKRRILAECAYWYDKVNASATEKYPQPDLGARFEVAMPILLLLALPYRDHLDYRPEWAPDA